MKKEVAEYILALRDAEDVTRYSADRPVYKSYLANVAVLLALLENKASQNVIAEAVALHERLRGQLWLEDPVEKKSSECWEKVMKYFSN